MFGHWIVVASQKEARFFTEMPKESGLKLLKSLRNPLGGEKRRALVRKQAGKGVKLMGRHGTVRYSEPKRRDPVEEAATQFARNLVESLEADRQKKNFISLTIVAEPHFLGKIRAAMTSGLKRKVIKWMGKDLQKTPFKELPSVLRDARPWGLASKSVSG